MRRLVAAGVVAAAAFGVSSPASASYECRSFGKNGSQRVGACYGSWCPDECFVVASTTCEGFSPTWCDQLDGLGSPPGGRR